MPYTIDDLPRFSEWPERLLNLKFFAEREKSSKEVTREYEKEKWGRLLKKYLSQKSKPSLKIVDRWFMEDNRPLLIWEYGRFVKSMPLQAHNQYLKLINKTLREFLPAKALVELGAGYGSVILRMKHLASLCRGKFFAGEYTQSGVKLLRLLAEKEKIALAADLFDFRDMEAFNLDLPHGSVIYTSYATSYIKNIRKSFVDNFLKYKPKAVIHFEPLYEDCADSSLTSLLRRRYIEVNGYNRNLKTILNKEAKRGRIQIVCEKPNVFGANPLLAASIIVWKPLR